MYFYDVCGFIELQGTSYNHHMSELAASEIDVALPVVLVLLQLEFEVDTDTPATGTLRMSGYIRSRVMSVNQLVSNPVGT